MPRELTIQGHTLHFPDPGSNVGWVRLGEVFMLFGRAGKAPEDRMNLVFEQLGHHGIEAIVGASLGSIRLTSVQRKRISEYAKGKKLISIMDHNPIARGIVTALGWIGLKIKLFYWSELDEALAFIDPREVSPEALSEVFAAVQSFLHDEPDLLSAAS